MFRVATVLITLSLTAACTSGTERGPSLLPRAVEKQSFDEPVAPPAPVATPDPALDAKIAGLVASRVDAVAGFAAADRRLSGQLAGGAKAAPGSDAWLDAQTAIGALDAGRADLLGVLTELEQLASARAAELQPPYPTLDAARAETETEVDRVSAIVAARKAALPL